MLSVYIYTTVLSLENMRVKQASYFYEQSAYVTCLKVRACSVHLSYDDSLRMRNG